MIWVIFISGVVCKFYNKICFIYCDTFSKWCVPHRVLLSYLCSLLTQELFQDIDHAEEWEHWIKWVIECKEIPRSLFTRKISALQWVANEKEISLLLRFLIAMKCVQKIQPKKYATKKREYKIIREPISLWVWHHFGSINTSYSHI